MTDAESTSDERSNEGIRERSGDNVYPVTFTARFGDHQLDLDVPGGVWNPTPHGVHLANALLSLDFSGQHVLELGTGCGIHAILLAERGATRLTLTEIEREILDNGIHNLRKHGCELEVDGQIADWTTVAGGPYDTIVTNPPFCQSGKRYRRYFIDTLILDAHKLVRPGGRLVFVQSSMADVQRSLSLMQDNGMSVEIVAETDGEFRQYYFDDPSFLREAAAVSNGFELRDGKHYERLTVFDARLP